MCLLVPFAITVLTFAHFDAGSAHGLGTAALSAKEPAALPFCALAYAIIGIMSSVLATIPIVRGALIAITV